MMPHRHPFVKALADALRLRCGVRAGARLVVAVSGGADSVALLRALAMLAPRRTWRLRLAVGHVQHHLRRQAEADAAFVAALADQLGLPLLRADLDAPPRGKNVEAWARSARYRALAEMADAFEAPAVVVAHHADDQLETMLMRLLRGASVTGLAAMPWRRRLPLAESERATSLQPLLLRPMLAVDRQQVRRFLSDLKQPWREDHTNADVTRLRAYFRKHVLPPLRSAQPHAARRAVATADHLRQVSRMLARAVDRAADRMLRDPDGLAVDRAEARLLPVPVLAGLLRKLLTEAGAPRDKLGGRTIAPLIRAIRDTEGGRRAFALGRGVKATVTRDTVRVEIGMKHRPDPSP